MIAANQSAAATKIQAAFRGYIQRAANATFKSNILASEYMQKIRTEHHPKTSTPVTTPTTQPAPSPMRQAPKKPGVNFANMQPASAPPPRFAHLLSVHPDAAPNPNTNSG